MSERSFQLSQFYFGVFSGQQQAKPVVLARTPNITPEQVAESIQVGRIEPPLSDQVSDEMLSSVGLFRGPNHYILGVAQITATGSPQLHYLLLDTAPVSWLGGNFQPFIGLVRYKMPVFDAPRTLPPLKLDDPRPADEERQTTVLSELMLYCQDNPKVIEALLTALIEGKDIAILNAPLSLMTRLTFIEGLIHLLPLPARLILTFVTNVVKAENSSAQIKFMATQTPPAEHVIYDWEASTITPTSYECHTYARFIVSQLRLDPSQVLKQTDSLTKTAGWRAIRKEDLATALHWVSRRAKVDSAVLARQPADRETVAGILREDPTLTDDLRVAYSQHLLAFTLALREWETVDLLPALAAGNKEIAEAIFNQLREAAAQDHPIDVVDLVEHWLVAVSAAASLPWQQVFYSAALAHLQKLISADKLKDAAAFVDRLCQAHSRLEIDKIAPKLLGEIQTAAFQSPDLALAVFIFAASYLPTGSFQELLYNIPLVKQFPLPLQQAIALLQPQLPSHPSLTLLARGISTLPNEYQPLILLRLVEIALHLQRPQLIGEPEFRALLKLNNPQQIERYRYVVKYLVDEFAQPSQLRNLPNTTWGFLPQLALTIGDIPAGVRLLEYYQNELFTPERLSPFTDLIGEVFLNLSASTQIILAALGGFEGSQIRMEPRARAFCASLINQQWDAKMEPAAVYLTAMLNNDSRLARIIGTNNVLRLLEFHAARPHLKDCLNTATALMQTAAQMGEKGPVLLVKAWQFLTWSPEMREAGIEIIRQFIRQLPPKQSAHLPEFFSQNIDREVGEALHATRLMRIIMGEQSFIEFTQAIHALHDLLRDLAITYHESKARPTVQRLRRDLDPMTGGLTEQERQRTAINIQEISRLVYELGARRSQPKRTGVTTNKTPVLRMTSSRTNPMRNILNEARETMPQTPTDFLNWLSLYFGDTVITDLGLERAEAAHIFDVRSAAVLHDEAKLLREFLQRLADAFPEDKPPQSTVQQLHAEVTSLWNHVRLYDQKQLQPTLTVEPQRTALLMRLLANRASERFLGDRGVGQQLEAGRREPENELEALRWISGYFGRKHTKQ